MATFTPLATSVAQQLLDLYPLASLREVLPIAGGSVNSNYRLILADDTSVFVRIFEEQGPEGAHFDASLLTHLAAHGVPSPEPIPTRAGEPLAWHPSGKPVALFPFVVGVHGCQQSIDIPRAHAVGASLASIHCAGESFPLKRESRFAPDMLRLRLKKIANASDPELAAMAPQIASALTHHETLRKNFKTPEGLVHGDLFRDNVFFANETSSQIVALLDFESASNGVFAYDLAVTLLAWTFGNELQLDLVQAMVAGYCSVRQLSDEELAAMPNELALASLRFTTTRITDYAMRTGVIGARVVKDWRRFWSRFAAVTSLSADVLSPVR